MTNLEKKIRRDLAIDIAMRAGISVPLDERGISYAGELSLAKYKEIFHTSTNPFQETYLALRDKGYDELARCVEQLYGLMNNVSRQKERAIKKQDFELSAKLRDEQNIIYLILAYIPKAMEQNAIDRLAEENEPADDPL